MLTFSNSGALGTCTDVEYILVYQLNETVMKALTIDELNILFSLGFKRIDSNAYGLVADRYWYNGIFFVTIEKTPYGGTFVNVMSGKGKPLLILNSVSELLNYPL